MIWIQIRNEEAKPGGKVEHDRYIKAFLYQVKASTDFVEYASLPERDVNVSRRLEVSELFFVA